MWEDCLLLIIIIWQLPISSSTRDKIFGSYPSMHARKTRDITFHLGGDSRFRPAKFITAHACSRGCGRGDPRKHLACCEKRRNDVSASLRYYTQWRSHVSRERSEAEAGGPCREWTRALAWRDAVKQKGMCTKSKRFLIVHKGRVDCPDNGGTDMRLVYT